MMASKWLQWEREKCYRKEMMDYGIFRKIWKLLMDFSHEKQDK
jgi:hypothetical protein